MKSSFLTTTFVSLFPDNIDSIVQSSILGRAILSGVLRVQKEQIRDHSEDKFKRVDDKPFGGGPGQLMRVDCVVKAIRASRAKVDSQNTRVILTEAAGKLFDAESAKRLAQYDHLIFVCGRYEGIDARIHHYVDESLSIGNYVNTGGELAALVMFDAIARHVPGVLGNEASYEADSFENGLLEHSQYTKPMEFEGHCVPPVLISGHHKNIEDERKKEQILRTQVMRNTVLSQNAELSSKNCPAHNIVYPWNQSD